MEEGEGSGAISTSGENLPTSTPIIQLDKMEVDKEAKTNNSSLATTETEGEKVEETHSKDVSDLMNDEFLVLDEEDCEGDDDDDLDQEEREEEKTPLGNELIEINDSDSDDECIVINPLYTRDQSQVENGEGTEIKGENVVNESEEQFKLFNCGSDECFHQKASILTGMARLEKAIVELSKRNAMLEDFIQVEFDYKFNRFNTKREHLLSMGFGGGEDSDGKRSAKNTELMELLVMTKSQAQAKAKSNEKGNPPKKSTPQPSSSKPSQSSPKKPSSSSLSASPRKQPVKDNSSRDQLRSLHQKSKGINKERRKNIDLPPRFIKPLMPASYSYYSSYKETKPAPSTHRTTTTSSRSTSSTVKNILQKHKNSSSSSRSSLTNQGMRISTRTSKSSPASTSKGPRERIRTPSSSDNNMDLNHILSIPTLRRVCPLCNKVIQRKALKKHLLYIHKNKMFLCSSCDHEYPERKQLRLHLVGIHAWSEEEANHYIDKQKKASDDQERPWLDKMFRVAMIPTREQLIHYYDEFQESQRRVALNKEMASW